VARWSRTLRGELATYEKRSHGRGLRLWLLQPAGF